MSPSLWDFGKLRVGKVNFHYEEEVASCTTAARTTGMMPFFGVGVRSHGMFRGMVLSKKLVEVIREDFF